MKNLVYEEKGSIATLKIFRPTALNALNREVLTELKERLELSIQEKQVKALILTGEGDKAFVAGADIREMNELDQLEMMHFCSLGQEVSLLLENAPFLTLAAVNGYALGGGLELALACDFIYASKNARLGLPEITLGIIPGFGGTQRLSRAIGTRKAKEMILTGKTLTAEEAEKIGIVNHVCDPQNLFRDSESAAETVAKYSFTAIQQAKKAINLGYSLDLPAALELEKNLCSVCFSTPERGEGMRAFLEKKRKG